MKVTTRQLVKARAGNRCEYCRLHQDQEPYYRFHIEHIIAQQHRGGDDPANLALSCHHCNSRKGTNLSAVDPQTGNIVRLFDPRRQNWSRHFRLVQRRVVGITECGRASVTLLGMNQRSRIALR